MGERSDCEERVMAEKEYIERDRLYELSYWHGATPTLEDPFPDGVDAVDTNDIDSIPAADVRPVVRARWEEFGEAKQKFYSCSNCFATHYRWDNFCPNCGADMREES